VLSAVLAVGGAGKLAMGWVADRIGGRRALSVTMIAMAVGVAMLMGARHQLALILFVAVYGFTVGAPLALIPILMAESLGLKRFGSLFGLLGIFHTAGAAMGPLIAGRIFDLSGSYHAALELFVVLLAIGAAAVLGCTPLPAEHAPSIPVTASA
jgi:MFS family permease